MQSYIGCIFIVWVCAEVVLVCLGKVRKGFFPFIIYGIGAGMILMTSLAGPYLVGSDIHLEYYYANLRAGVDVIPPLAGIPQGTSILSYFTNNIWVYKIVYPLLFALVPVILYFIFRRFLDETRAFLASFFLIAFTPFYLELPGIPRQMVAEFLLVLMLYFMYVSNWKYRWVPVVVCGALIPLIHYSVGVVSVIFLGVMFILRRNKLVGLGLIAIVLACCIWFPISENGAVARKLVHIYNNWVPGYMEIPYEPAAPRFFNPDWVGLSKAGGFEDLLLRGLGFDFLESNIVGKIFRVIQWVILGIMAAGLFKLVRDREYRVFALGGVILVLLMGIPGFSGILNATRFLHLALLLLAPLVAVTLKPKYLLVALVPYFLFASGFIFEATKQPDIERYNIPYNICLSDYRIDLGAGFNEDDKKVREYILKNKLFPIVADIYGTDFLGEMIGWRDDLCMPLSRTEPKVSGVYVFVRSRNIQEGTFTVWNGVGLRKYIRPEKFGIDWDKDIVYQSGDSRVLRVK